MRDLKYLLAYSAPLLGFLGLFWGGFWTYGVLIEAFVLIPILEQFLPFSKENTPVGEEAKRSKIFFFDLLLYLHVPIVFTLIFFYFQNMARGEFSLFEVIGMTLSTGIILGSFGINVAHELGHRSSKAETFLAKLLLLPNLYLHFIIEHNRGHHKNVATAEDPATAKFGETVYEFWIRSVIGSYRNAWRLEADRLGKFGLPPLHWRNEMIYFQIAQAAYLLGVGFWFGWQMIGFAVLIATIGFLLLETVNYIEHYGLRRKKQESGRYEPVQIHHSWNSDHELGRIFLYELTRHADHHYKANRKYQILRSFEESPQLPLGYPGSMLLSLLPPLWFKVMNPKAAQFA